jgi:hypothetical protein
VQLHNVAGGGSILFVSYTFASGLKPELIDS